MKPRNKTVEEIRSQKRLARGLLIVGIVCVVIGIFVFNHSRRFYRSAIHAPGKIVEVEQRRSQKDVTSFPVFSFVDRAGATHVIHSRVGYTSNRRGLTHQYAVGDAVEVLYAANDPDGARLNDLWSAWTWTIVFGGTGTILAGAGIVLWQGAASWMRQMSSRDGYDEAGTA